MPTTKKAVELDYETFIASIANWDGASPPFDEVMRSALMQAALMGRCNEFNAELHKRTGLGFSVPRYALGLSLPMRGVMTCLVRETRAVLVELHAKMVEENHAFAMLMRHGPDCGDDD
jgi:hypothetical protein